MTRRKATASRGTARRCLMISSRSTGPAQGTAAGCSTPGAEAGSSSDDNLDDILDADGCGFGKYGHYDKDGYHEQGEGHDDDMFDGDRSIFRHRGAPPLTSAEAAQKEEDELKMEICRAQDRDPVRDGLMKWDQCGKHVAIGRPMLVGGNTSITKSVDGEWAWSTAADSTSDYDCTVMSTANVMTSVSPQAIYHILAA